MKLRRFQVKKEWIRGQEAVITDRAEIKHIHKVLRLKSGDRVILFDGEGEEHSAIINDLAPGKISFKVLSPPLVSSAESSLKIILGAAVLKSSKFDWLIQKVTELGVGEIVPFYSGRVIPQWEGGKISSRQARWKKIIAEAAKQCGRAKVPPIHPPCSFAEALQKPLAQTAKIFLWEKEEKETIKEVLKEKPAAVYALIGPEGGFSDQEAYQARQAGFHSIRLGPRILRSETAGIAVVSLLQFLLGDWN